MNYQDISTIRYDPQRKQRIAYSALSGFLIGTIATIASSFINVWRFPELPIYLEWSWVFIMWGLFALVGGILAGVAGASQEGWTSILISAVGLSFVILFYSVLQSSESMLLRIVSLVGLLFPVAAMVTPLPVIFFWLGNRFAQASSSKNWALFKVIFVNCLVIIAVGILPGIYTRINSRAEKSVRIVHGILQDAARNSIHPSLSKAKEFSKHKSQPYMLSQSPSTYSTVGVDVTAHYDDGYTIMCTVVMYPGSEPAIYPCKEKTP